MKKKIKELKNGEMFVHEGRFYTMDRLRNEFPWYNEYYCFDYKNDMYRIFRGNTVVEKLDERTVPY